MATDELFARYEAASESLLRAGLEREAAEQRLEAATKDLEAADLVVKECKLALEDARLKIAQALEAASVSIPEPRTKSSSPPPPTLQKLILAMAETSESTLAELTQKMELADSTVNSRLQKAKAKGYVESAGWGKHRLTALGRSFAAPLRPVGD